MSAILHALNISTLATWLSVGAFGTVGIVVPTVVEISHRADKEEMPFEDLEVSLWSEDFAANDLPASQETDTGSTGEAAHREPDLPFAEVETLPEPPELPELVEETPLPEVPELPPPAPKAVAESAPAKPQAAALSQRVTRQRVPTSATGGSPQGREGARGSAGRGGSNGGTGMSDAKRLAGGRMPPPVYPSEARRKGQTGTVLVEFVVSENGRVVSAHAKRPSPWPLLNNAAVSAVRRWRFPAGTVTKYVRPIIFELR